MTRTDMGLSSLASELADWSKRVDRRLDVLEIGDDRQRLDRLLKMAVVVVDEDGVETHGAVTSIDWTLGILRVRLPDDMDDSLGGQLNHLARRIRNYEKSILRLVTAYTNGLRYIEDFDADDLAHYMALRIEQEAEF